MQADRPIDRHADTRADKTADNTTALVFGVSHVSVYGGQADMWAIGRPSGMMISYTPHADKRVGRRVSMHTHRQACIHCIHDCMCGCVYVCMSDGQKWRQVCTQTEPKASSQGWEKKCNKTCINKKKCRKEVQ